MGQHVTSTRGFGKYEITIGGSAGENGEDADIFTYDVNTDKSGADVIVNFKNVRESEAEQAAR